MVKMKNTITLVMFIALLSSIAHGQSVKVLDSLKNELSLAKQDTNRILVLIEISSGFR